MHLEGASVLEILNLGSERGKRETRKKLPPIRIGDQLRMHSLLNPVTSRSSQHGTMNIDDILREVDPSSRVTLHETGDLQSLTRLWVAERSAPELMR